MQRSYDENNKSLADVLNKISAEEVTNDEIKDYLGELKDTIENIADHLDFDSQNR